MLFRFAVIIMLIGGIFVGGGLCNKNREKKIFGIKTICAGAVIQLISGILSMSIDSFWIM